MPWKDVTVMDERIRFVARLLEGEQMAGLCREFGISRKTGYKIFDRYKECGVEAISDRPRRPYRYGNQLPPIDTSKRTSCRRVKTYQPRARHFFVNPSFLPKQEPRLGDCV